MTSFYDEIEIEDFNFNEETNIFTYPCPCGDQFQISMEDLINGEEIARCPSCSLILRVIYDPDDFQHDSETERVRLIDHWIKFNGPITVAQYMRFALLYPKDGYYSSGSDVIGKKGDFITSPEISQLFGEMVAIWFASLLKNTKKDQKFSYFEIGPGNGTLAADILRTFKSLNYTKNLYSIDLVEPSIPLRKKQLDSICRVFNSPNTFNHTRNSVQLENNVSVNWFNDVIEISKSSTNESYKMIVAHELFDALPIHQLQMTSDGLREVLIDNVDGEFKFVLSNQPTSAISLYLSQNRHVESEVPIGETIEFSPAACGLIDDIASIISDGNGCALIMDYGRNGASPASLRGIRKHQLVHPLSSIGETDISADVDFKILAERINKKERSQIFASNLLSQSQFLIRMGIRERLLLLLNQTHVAKEKDQLVSGVQRIIGERKGEMGNIYKFMALTSTQDPYPFY